MPIYTRLPNPRRLACEICGKRVLNRTRHREYSNLCQEIQRGFVRRADNYVQCPDCGRTVQRAYYPKHRLTRLHLHGGRRLKYI